MREIKFRFWWKDSMVNPGDFIYDKFYLSLSGQLYDYSEYNEIEGGRLDPLDSVVVMQYTGLKDKNGTEIYEGDILKIKDSFIGLIKAEITPQWFHFLMQTNSIAYKSLHDWEIIGNIYENGELLND